jgi:hypothetical protein
MLLAAMLAMVLAATAPAFGQATVTPTVSAAVDFATTTTGTAAASVPGGPSVVVSAGDEQYTTDIVNQAVCQSIAGAAAALQYTNQQGLAGEDLAQRIADEQNVSVEQVNECLNQLGATASPSAIKKHTASPTAKKSVPPKKHTATATSTAAAGGGGGGGGGGTAAAASLPPTGGIGTSSALALGAGALLVAGGLVARRLLR